MKYKLHFHLGPVQSFVVESRRTRDIWAGSFILSWLAAEAFAEVMGDKLQEKRVESPRSFSSDPIFQAVHARRTAKGKIGRPICSTFPNHFSVEVETLNAGEAAAKRIRQCWLNLAQAVEEMIFETPLANGDTLRILYPKANVLFKSQIGDCKATPLWEIYSVVELANRTPRKGMRALDMRKMQRWGDDARYAPTVQNGGFCSMLSGWQEISSSENLGVREKAEFWQNVRDVTLKVRYKKDFESYVCLDLAQKEQLSAPALVKRLFPILGKAKLEEIFGWAPVFRSSTIEKAAREAEKNGLLQTFVGNLFQYFRGSPDQHFDLTAFEDEAEGFAQSPCLWPSTSYLAAAHWINRVHTYAPSTLTSALRASIRAAGPHLAVAEQSLFVPCTRIGLDKGDLRAVDGACLFENSVTRMEKDTGHAAYGRIRENLGKLAAVPIDERNHALGLIGHPAPIYAVVRADGDDMGRRLSDNKELSESLGKFTAALRGGAKDGDIGVIARHNGVALYASADEMIAMCPLEDAIPLAVEVQQSFMKAMKRKDEKNPPTLSVAITYAHRQVPLGWVMRSGQRLLDGVAKDYICGNALAIEIMDTGGRRLQWGAPWTSPVGGIAGTASENPALEALQLLITEATKSPPAPFSFLGSNQFFHAFAQRLEAFFLPIDDASLSAVNAAYAAEWQDPVHVDQEARIIEQLLDNLLADRVSKEQRIHIKRIRENLVTISGILDVTSPTNRALRRSRMSAAGLKLLRFLAENWRKIEAETNHL